MEKRVPCAAFVLLVEENTIVDIAVSLRIVMGSGTFPNYFINEVYFTENTIQYDL
jgi:hypothetical protein